MPAPVITIARQLGSHGDELGHRLSQRLGIPLLAQEVLELAAREAGASLAMVEAAEHVPSWHERLLDSLGNSASMEPFSPSMMPTTLDRMLTSADYRRIINDVVRGLAARGPCVIVGHAGQVALRDIPRVLRTFVHAPFSVRAGSIAAERDLRLQQAENLVREDDKQRSSLFSTYYHVRWDDPELYVLALDTSALGLDAAEEIVLTAARRLGETG